MKIIDEKGRLFGKINLIDLLVIVLVVAVVAAVGWKLVGKKAAASVSITTMKSRLPSSSRTSPSKSPSLPRRRLKADREQRQARLR